MIIKRIIESISLLMLMMLVNSISGCHNNDEVKEEIPVGVVLPLSGSLEALGVTLRNAAELALEEINAKNNVPQSKNLRFIIEDSGSTPEGAVAAYNKLIQNDGVNFIIGPTTSSASKEAFPIAQQNQVIGFSPLAAAKGLSDIGDFIFQANLTVDVVIPGGVELTVNQFGYQKVAILVDNTDLFSQSANNVLVETFNNKGIEILATEILATNDTDFTAQLTHIKTLNPDAIFISTLPNEAVRILTQARTIGIPNNVTIIIPLAFSTVEVEQAGSAAEGVVTFSTWVSTAETPGNQAFVESYQEQYGAEPSRFLAQQYAAVHIFAEALNTAQATDSSAIRDALLSIKDFDTILGKFSFESSGRAVYDPIILVVKNGKLEVLSNP
ncbi:MAG: ABC transporter substrate-binding protein [Thiotrichaceae bacterium]